MTLEMRQYVASSIEDQSAWAGEVAATQQALAHSELRRITDDRTLLLLPRGVPLPVRSPIHPRARVL